MIYFHDSPSIEVVGSCRTSSYIGLSYMRRVGEPPEASRTGEALGIVERADLSE